MFRPGKIDFFLRDKPELKEKFEQLATRIDVSVDATLEQLRDAGCQTTRSAVGRWRQKMRGYLGRHGPYSVDRVAVFTAVMSCPRKKIRQLLEWPELQPYLPADAKRRESSHA